MPSGHYFKALAPFTQLTNLALIRPSDPSKKFRKIMIFFLSMALLVGFTHAGEVGRVRPCLSRNPKSGDLP